MMRSHACLPSNRSRSQKEEEKDNDDYDGEESRNDGRVHSPGFLLCISDSRATCARPIEFLPGICGKKNANNAAILVSPSPESRFGMSLHLGVPSLKSTAFPLPALPCLYDVGKRWSCFKATSYEPAISFYFLTGEFSWQKYFGFCTKRYFHKSLINVTASGSEQKTSALSNLLS